MINIDDKYGMILAESVSSEACTLSLEGREATLCAVDIRFGLQTGTEFKISSRNMRLRVRTVMPGSVNVMNTLCAVAALDAVGVSLRDIKEGIASFGGVSGRFERLKWDERLDFSVYIDYAHTPDALESLLRTAKQVVPRGGRIVIVFGCGGDREMQKRALMGRVASQMADVVVITSDNPRSEEPIEIINDIMSGITDGAICTVIEDRRAAIEYALKNARRGDVILLAGKGHEEYVIDKLGRHHFSEREICREMIRKYCN